ncbi:MAG: GatB/YqeY domain-containing protein [Hyphomicrobiales bacterium]
MTSALRDRIDQALKEAMKSKDKRRMATTRLINAAIKDRHIQNRSAGKGDGVDDGEVMEILAKMIKQRRDSIKMYESAGRCELAEQEREEIAIVEEFLPAQLGEEEMGEAVEATIAELGASGLKDMGRTMGLLKEKYAGQMDFGKASAMVKSKLG